MKTKDFSKKLLVALTMMLALAMNAKAQKSTQDKRVMAFQTVMAMHDTTYKNLIKDGKYKEAIAPLTKLINILDTTTICQDTELSLEMIKAAKADYLYDQACCYALTKQKKLALATLGKSVDSGYKRYDNMLNDNDLASLRKDKKYQALLAEVKDRQPLSVLKKSVPYAQDAAKMDNPFRYESKDSKCLSVLSLTRWLVRVTNCRKLSTCCTLPTTICATTAAIAPSQRWMPSTCTTIVRLRAKASTVASWPYHFARCISRWASLLATSPVCLPIHSITNATSSIPSGRANCRSGFISTLRWMPG